MATMFLSSFLGAGAVIEEASPFGSISTVAVTLWLAVSVFFLFSFAFVLNRPAKLKGMPGPTGHWLLGSLPEYQKYKHFFIQECHKKYGDTICLYRGNEPVVFVRDPKGVAKVLSAPVDTEFTKGRDLWGSGFLYKCKRFVDGMYDTDKLPSNSQPVTDIDNLLQPSVGISFVSHWGGSTWRNGRRAVNPMFMPEAIGSLTGKVVEITEELFAYWDEQIKSSKDGKLVVDIQNDIHRVTLDTAILAITGHAPKDWDAIVPGENLGTKMVDHFTGCLNHFTERYSKDLKVVAGMQVPVEFEKDVTDRMHAAHSLVARVVAERKSQDYAGGTDMIALLLSAPAETRQADQCIVSTCVNLIIAGGESNASGMGFALSEIAANPVIQERLRGEVDAALGKSPPTVDKLGELVYTEQCYREGMRLFPPATMVFRMAARDTELNGYKLPKGTKVGVCMYAVHRNENVYNRPDQYSPENFSADAQAERSGQGMSFVPFSAGARGCPGRGLAYAEAKVCFSMIAQRYTLGAVEGWEPKPIGKFNTWSGNGIQIEISPRAC